MDEHTTAPSVQTRPGDRSQEAERAGLAPAAQRAAAPRPMEALEAPSSRPGMRSLRRLAFPLMGLGLTATVAASVALMTGHGSPAPNPSKSMPPPVTAPAPDGLTLSGPSDVHVERTSYQPGQASSWHMHTGLHAVEVMAGTLTIYDQHCQAHTYGPGESYIGGGDEHMARNDTDAPVDMVVTYMVPAGTSMAQFVIPMPPPSQCGVATGAPTTDNGADG